MEQFSLGEFIEFGKPNGMTRHGRVLKINDKTVKVDVDGVVWTVANPLCRRFSGLARHMEIKEVYSGNKLVVTSSDFKVGDRVSFGRDNGQRTVGIVTKVNPKNLKIRTTESRGMRESGVEWNVHPKLCALVEKEVPVVKVPVVTVPVQVKEQLTAARYFAACT